MSLKNSTEYRQQAIKELIKKNVISDQKRLVELLYQHYHIETNQAAVSRDLHKLGIVKKVINGVLSYEVPETDVSTEILKLALIDITLNEAIIVIKTYPGLADFVGDCVDRYDDLDVLGCLAGENVVFVTPKSIKAIQTTYEKICNRFNFIKRNGS